MPVHFCFHCPSGFLVWSATEVACLHAPGRRTSLTSCTALRGGWSLIEQCPASCPHPPPSGPLPWSLPLPWPDPPTSSPSPSLGSRDGGAVRQAQPPAPMAARRSQRRRGRRGEPGTALLAPLVLSLGLALACLGLLLVVVSLGSWATLSAQVRPSTCPFLGILGAESAENQMRAGWAEGQGIGEGVEDEMSGEGQGDAASFPAGAFSGGPDSRGPPGAPCE